MRMFSIKNAEFYNEFYNKLNDYVNYVYQVINSSLLNDTDHFYHQFFNEEELALIIIINKVFFQNLIVFFQLINEKISMPAFNALRSSIECERLFRLFYLDDKFRREYMENQNLDFDTVFDRKFQQSKICKRLDEIEKKLREKDIIPLIENLRNHELTHGSAISRLHSELSKWSHCLNVNLLKMYFITNGKIYLGLDDEFDEKMQLCVRKYTEASYLILTHHEDLFHNLYRNENYMNKSEEMLRLYEEYIEYAYKS